jgi:uncharacterized protein with NRDE domain
MCLILIGYRVHAGAPLVVAANRDEFYARPSADAHLWPERPEVIGGRDLSAGGTWLAASRARRFAAVTNFPAAPRTAGAAPPSRGRLAAGFMASRLDVGDYWQNLRPEAFQGFNLLAWDGHSLAWGSSRGSYRELPPGFYGLANADLDTPWPKVLRGTTALQRELVGALDVDRLIALLFDQSIPPDEELPDRGNSLDLERRVAPIFIAGEDYGTRASTVVVFGDASLRFTEVTYGPRARQESFVHYAVGLPPAAD